MNINQTQNQILLNSQYERQEVIRLWETLTPAEVELNIEHKEDKSSGDNEKLKEEIWNNLTLEEKELNIL